MADLDVRVYGRGSPPTRFPVGPVQTLQASTTAEAVRVSEAVITSSQLGIAANYPGDVGIESDPDVLFVEKFEEASIAALAANWSDYRLDASGFSSDVPVGSPGAQSLRLTQNRVTLPQAQATIFKNLGGLGNTQPVFARCYFKYPNSATRPDHSGIWMGGNDPELSFPYVPPGTLPPTADSDDNWFSLSAEVVDATGRLEHYNYWPAMHADGGGAFWGNFLLMDPNVVIPFNQWFCLEVMCKPNTPPNGFNGEQAIWLNGVKVSHLGPGFPNGTWNGNQFTQNPAGPTPFEGFKWSTLTALDPNWVWLQCYNGSIDSTIFVDHFVVARRYIGPMFTNLNIIVPAETVRARANTVSVIRGNTGQVAFNASPDHASVTNYEARLRAQGSDTVIDTSTLGTPTPDGNGVIIVDLSAFFAGQAAGNYTLSVAATDPGGTTDSAYSPPFALPLV